MGREGGEVAARPGKWPCQGTLPRGVSRRRLAQSPLLHLPLPPPLWPPLECHGRRATGPPNDLVWAGTESAEAAQGLGQTVLHRQLGGGGRQPDEGQGGAG